MWTVDRILALAPDASSVKSGRELAIARKWSGLGQTKRAIWGECQGSGTKPYQTEIDTSEPAFRCTCPSRKFPCKHALALFLLSAAEPNLFSVSVPPPWVQEWLKKRDEKAAEQTREKPSREATSDPEAAARRVAARESKVTAGIAELEGWLRDVARQGLANLQQQPFGYFDRVAARMVDAQAPGLARQVRQISALVSSSGEWHAAASERVGRLFLLLQAYGRLDSLPPELRADIRSLIGWTEKQEELLEQPGVQDDWDIMSLRVEEDERLRTQRNWLLGRQTGRAALILNFAYGNAPLDVSLVPGTRIQAELVFFPGLSPSRALIRQKQGTGPMTMPAGFQSVTAALETYGLLLAQNPWLVRLPVLLSSVVPIRREERWHLRDGVDKSVRLSASDETCWRLLALSGGRPMSVFGEWTGDRLEPLGVWAEGRYVWFYRSLS